MKLPLPPLDRVTPWLPAIAPSLAVVSLWVFGMKPGPAGASGSTYNPDEASQITTIDLPSRPRLDPEAETLAAENEASLNAVEIVGTPFFVPKSSQIEHRIDLPDITAAEHLHLSSMMNTPRGAVAVINGKAHRVGDTIVLDETLELTVTITAIDLKGRTATLADAEGHNVEISLRRRGDSN